MELQDNPDTDVEQTRPKRTRAEAGESYPIRILHLNTGLLIIGYVIESYPNEVILMLRPHVISLEYDREEGNVEEYEFVPYLNQLIAFEPNGLDPTPFIMSNVISVNMPAEHVLKNFESVIHLKSLAAVDPERIKLQQPHYLTRTVH